MINNVLLLARISNGNINSKPETYTIWDSYREALQALIKNFYYYDYYDIYFSRGKQGFENFIEEIIKKNRIKYLFIGFAAEDYTFDLKFLVYLKHKYFLCIIHTTQDPETFFEPRDRYYDQIADYVLPFTFIPNGSIYNNYDIDTITLYGLYNKKLFQNQNLQKTIDVTFIGNVNKANRKTFLDFLVNKGIKVEVYGPGSKNGTISHKKMIEIINKSKINLNFTDSAYSTYFDYNTNTNFTIGTKINARIQQAKGRLIEIYLCKSFCLSQEGYGTRSLINDDRIIFADQEDLVNKIKLYLKNDKLREQITKELYDKSLEYDAINKFKTILPKLEYKSKFISNIYLDEVFIKNYASYRFLYLFNFLYKLKFKLAFNEFKVVLKYKKIDFNTIFYHFKMQTIYAYRRYRRISK
ncbi:glycosyltransferase family protein [Aliarcobacter sp. ERUVET-7]|uniref:glycosyltransferase family protein n=1 Tax=Aliarcobacter sp. ERUVET-7 TaxID=3429683 RepID=UPI003D6AF207